MVFEVSVNQNYHVANCLGCYVNFKKKHNCYLRKHALLHVRAVNYHAPPPLKWAGGGRQFVQSSLALSDFRRRVT